MAGIVWGKVAAKLFIGPEVRLTLKTQNLLLVFLKQIFCWYYPNVEGIFMLMSLFFVPFLVYLHVDGLIYFRPIFF